MFMKQGKRALCMSLALAMLLLCCACGKNDPTEWDYMSVVEENSNTAKTTAADTSDVGGEEDPDSSTDKKDKNTGKKTTTKAGKTTTTTTKKKSAAGTTTVDEFLKSMPAKLKGTTIDFFHWADLHNSAYKDALAKFEKDTGITVKFSQASHSAFKEDLASRVAAGNSPDVMELIYSTPATVANIQPITNSGYDFNDKAWDKDIMDMFTYAGRCYGVQVTDSPNRNMGMIYYNKKTLKTVPGIEDPYTLWKNNPNSWTWEKLWSMCDQFLEAKQHKEGYFGITFGENDGYVKCFGVSLWDFDTKTHKCVNHMKEANTVKRYTELMDAIEKKRSTSQVNGDGFEKGKILFNWSYSSMVERDNAGFAALKKQKNVGVVPCPSDSTVTPLFETCAYGIPVGAKNKEAVPYLLRCVFDPSTNDVENFYINEEAKTAVEAAAKKKLFFGNGYEWSIWESLVAGGPSNVKSVLDSFDSAVSDTVMLQNEQMNTLPK